MPAARHAIFALLSLSLLLALPVQAAADDPVVESDQIVAIVDGEAVTHLDVLQRVRLKRAYRELQRRSDPQSDAQRKSFERMTVLELCEEVLIRQAAAEAKVTLDGEDLAEINLLIDRRADVYGGRVALAEKLRERGTSLDAYRKAEEVRLLAGKLYFEAITKQIFIRPEQLKDAYEEDPARFVRKAKTQVRRIRLGVRDFDLTPAGRDWLRAQGTAEAPAKWDADACRALADSVRGRILAGEDAGLLAREFTSRESERTSNGLLEFESETEEYAPVEGIKGLDEIVEGMREGEVSEVTPIEGSRGLRAYDIVMLELRRKRSLEPFDRAQDDIKRDVRGTDFRLRLQAYLQGLKRASRIIYFPF